MNSQQETALLIRLSEMVSFAEYLPLEVIAQRNPEPEYPVTVGELLASYILNIVLRHEWQLEKNEYVAEPLLNVLGQLDMGVDRPDMWKDLFEANSELRKYLQSEGVIET